MIGSHPGGLALTERLLGLSGAEPPARVLDLGAGDGGTVSYLRERGFQAEGIDLHPSGEWAQWGDMRSLNFASGIFDLGLAECSMSVCGDAKAALREAQRVLKASGSLLVSDVFFHREDLAPSLSMKRPLTLACWKQAFAEAGFMVLQMKDETPLWRQFFLESLWNDNADETFCEYFRAAGRAKCGYFLAWLQKGETDGFI